MKFIGLGYEDGAPDSEVNRAMVGGLGCVDVLRGDGHIAIGQVCKPKFSIGPYGFITWVMDAEGNVIGLHSSN